jgi:predicted oxidoreductase
MHASCNIVRGYGDPGEAVRGDGTLEDAMLHGHCLQAYGPLGAGKIGRDPEDNAPESVRQVHAKAKALAAEFGCTSEAVALAWLLKHPARILPIIGTANLQRIADCCVAPDLELSREQWYELYVAARGRNMP